MANLLAYGSPIDQTGNRSDQGSRWDDDPAFAGAGRPAYQTTQTPSRLSTAGEIMGSSVGCRADN
jgi:hypothetical protein